MCSDRLASGAVDQATCSPNAALLHVDWPLGFVLRQHNMQVKLRPSWADRNCATAQC